MFDDEIVLGNVVVSNVSNDLAPVFSNDLAPVSSNDLVPVSSTHCPVPLFCFDLAHCSG